MSNQPMTHVHDQRIRRTGPREDHWTLEIEIYAVIEGHGTRNYLTTINIAIAPEDIGMKDGQLVYPMRYAAQPVQLGPGDGELMIDAKIRPAAAIAQHTSGRVTQ